MYDIAIIGGGASGLIAAIQCKRRAPARSLALLERQNRVGRKLLATGNGRCNLTNLGAGDKDYHGGTAILGEAMRRYPPRSVVAYFQTLGVEPLYEEDKVYPLSEQASSVLDALRLTLAELGVEPQCDCEIRSIRKTGGGYALTAVDGRALSAKKLIVAAGSMSSPSLGGTELGYKLLKGLGHAIVPCRPALVQLRTTAGPIRALTGIKVQGAISVLVDGMPARAERGEVLFTEYGLSGPPVLQLSRIASAALSEGRTVCVELKVLDEAPMEALRRRRELLKERPLEHFLTGMLNKRLGQTLLKLSGCAPLSRRAGSLSDSELQSLSDLMTSWVLPVTGTQGMGSAQVAAGGADTAMFDPRTLESRICPGLYAAGELLDIDGDCGGYNLQWAWASGLLAADSLIEALSREES